MNLLICLLYSFLQECLSTSTYDLTVVWERVTTDAMANSRHRDPDEYIALMDPDGSFSDLMYGSDGSNSFMEHGRRLSNLGYNNMNGVPDMEDPIVRGLSYITYDAPPNTDGNWWGHVIGTPNDLWKAIVLARDVIDHQLMTDFLNRWWVETPVGPVWNIESHEGDMTGGNLAPRAMLAEVEALLRDNFDVIHEQVKEAMHRELAQREAYNDAGLRGDGCLHQHSIQPHSTEVGYLDHILHLPYNHNYGKELLRFSATLLFWHSGLETDFEDATIEGLYSAYLECNQWLVRGHIGEPSNAGRKIDKGEIIMGAAAETSIWDVGNTLLEMGRHQDQIEAALHRYENAQPEEEFALNGNRFFYQSDLMVQHRRKYMASLRILSNRTCRPETWPDDDMNANGYFQADGWLSVLIYGSEFGTKKNHIFQVYDWAKVPGVTNLYTTDIPQFKRGPIHAEHFFNNEVFVGGVSNGMVGMATMPYQRYHLPLHANKTWFFFDDVIVALGSGITLWESHQTGESVITTISQINFSEGYYTMGYHNGTQKVMEYGSRMEEAPAWMHHDHIGYVFMRGDEVLHSSAQKLLGHASEISLFTCWLDHSPDPYQAGYAYAILPHMSEDATQRFAENPDVEILKHSSHMHAVCHKPSKTIGVVFAESGSSLTVETCGLTKTLEIMVQSPLLVLMEIADTSVITSIADPTQTLDHAYIWLTYGGQVRELMINLPTDIQTRGSSVTLTIDFP